MFLHCDIFVISNVNVGFLIFLEHVCLHQHLEVIDATGGLNRVLGVVVTFAISHRKPKITCQFGFLLVNLVQLAKHLLLLNPVLL